MILVSKSEKRLSDLSQHCREEMIDEIFDGRVLSNCVNIVCGYFSTQPPIKCKYFRLFLPVVSLTIITQALIRQITLTSRVTDGQHTSTF